MTPAELRNFHFFGAGPKRILSLDGGGVRGVLSLAFLERIERVLQARSGRADFRLCDYFSLIGGTSTGAIIAAGLALGHPVDKLIDLYLDISRQSFVKRTLPGLEWFGGKIVPKFDDEVLREAILSHFGDDTLGSSRIGCGLAIVAKRLDTGSVWLFHNHPDGKFFNRSHDNDEGFTPNCNLPIANLLRASTAAPSYFGPEHLIVAPGVEGLFVDGGVSPHNNPSLLLLMLATLEGYGFRWPMGDDRLMLVSVGTGSPQPRPMWGGTWHQTKPAAAFAVESLASMMYDSSWLAQTVLQWMSSSPTAWEIDSEIGDLAADSLGGKNLTHYLRYDAPIDKLWLESNIHMDFSEHEVAVLREMDRPEYAPRLLEIGRKAAKLQVRLEHFPAQFDVPPSA